MISVLERLSRSLTPCDAAPVDQQRAFIVVFVHICSLMFSPLHVAFSAYEHRYVSTAGTAIAGSINAVVFFLLLKRKIGIPAAQLPIVYAALSTVVCYLVEEKYETYHTIAVATMSVGLVVLHTSDIVTYLANGAMWVAFLTTVTIHAVDAGVTTVSTSDLPIMYIGSLLLLAMLVLVVRARTLLLNEYRKNLSYVKQQREFEAAMQQFLFHELRNPLVVAQGALAEACACEPQFFARAETTKEQAAGSETPSRSPKLRAVEHAVSLRDLLREGLRATHSMEKLLTDVQTVLQLRAGEYDVSREAVPMQSVVQSVLNDMEESGGPQLAVEWRGGEAMSTSVKTDRGALVRVLRHLLTNARKFGRSSVRMVLSMGEDQGGEGPRQLAPAGDEMKREYVSIEVRNDGAGMDEAALAEAFDLFQVRSHRRGGGSGLGLVECKLLTDAVGASLSLTSVVDGETCAVVRVPVWDDERDGAGEEPHARPEIDDSEIMSNPLLVLGGAAPVHEQRLLRVLFVDDVPMNRVVGVRMLMAASENVGRRPVVDVAGDGKEAVEKFKDALESMEAYDVVFMDVTMPVMNGWEATEEIRKLERDHGVGGPAQQHRCIVVAVTGNTLPVDVEKSLDAGMDDVFFKPYKIEYFRDAMNVAMDI